MVRRRIIRTVTSLAPLTHKNHSIQDKFFSYLYLIAGKLGKVDYLPDRVLLVSKVKEYGETILSRFHKETNGLPYENIIPFRGLKRMCNRWKLGVLKTSLRAILAYMQEEGWVVLRILDSKLFIKFTQNSTDLISDVDIAASKLRIMIIENKFQLSVARKEMEQLKTEVALSKAENTFIKNKNKILIKYRRLVNKENNLSDRVCALENQLETLQDAAILKSITAILPEVRSTLMEKNQGEAGFEIIDEYKETVEDVEYISEKLVLNKQGDEELKELENELSCLLINEAINDLPDVPKTLPTLDEANSIGESHLCPHALR